MNILEAAKAIESTRARPSQWSVDDRIVCRQFVEEAKQLARFVLTLEPSAELRADAERLRELRKQQDANDVTPNDLYETEQEWLDDMYAAVDAHLHALAQLTGETKETA